MNATSDRAYRLTIDLRNVALAAVALVVSVLVLIVVEVAARSRFAPEMAIAASESVQRALPLRERPPNSTIMLELAPTSSLIAAGMRPGTYSLSVDSLGFIEPSGDLTARASRLLFLGGSTTEGAFIDPESRFPHVVARLLTDSAGVPSVAFNAGRSGNTSLHSLINLIGKGLPIRPDVVVVMENINDLVRLAYVGTYAGMNSRTEGGQARGSMTIIYREPPDARSALGQAVAKVLPGMAFGVRRLADRASGTGADEFRGTVDQGITIDTAVIARDYRAMLRSIVAVARAHGAMPVIMTQPARFPTRLTDEPALEAFWLRYRKGVDYAAFVAAHSHLNDVARSVALMENVLLIDLAREFRPSRTNMYDFVHVTAEGSLQEAAIIARALGPAIGASDRSGGGSPQDR